MLRNTFSQNDEINVTYEPRPTLEGSTTDGQLVSIIRREIPGIADIKALNAHNNIQS